MRWTKEKCREEALKYQTRKDFSFHNHSAYARSIKNGWIEEICGHMIPLGNRHKKCAYSYEFPDKTVYVGIRYP